MRRGCRPTRSAQAIDDFARPQAQRVHAGRAPLLGRRLRVPTPSQDPSHRSRPGRRHYVGVDEIPRVRNGLGMAILSTSNGVLSDKIARQQGVGGELMALVW